MIFQCLKLHKKNINIQKENNIATSLSDLKLLNRIDITQLNNGKSAKVVEFLGNSEIMSKLEAMGIMPGVTITKKSAILGKGPVILEKDHVQFAIGYDMAKKIIVEPADTENGNGL